MNFEVQITIKGLDLSQLPGFLQSLAGGQSPMMTIGAKAKKELPAATPKKQPGRPKKAKAVVEEPEEEIDEPADEELETDDEDSAEAEDKDAPEEDDDEEEEEEETPPAKKKTKDSKKSSRLDLEGDLLPAFQAYAQKYTRDKAMKLLDKIGGVKSIRNVPEEKWPKLYEALQK